MKQHATNPRAQREARARQAKLERAERMAARQAEREAKRQEYVHRSDIDMHSEQRALEPTHSTGQVGGGVPPCTLNPEALPSDEVST